MTKQKAKQQSQPGTPHSDAQPSSKLPKAGGVAVIDQIFAKAKRAKGDAHQNVSKAVGLNNTRAAMMVRQATCKDGLLDIFRSSCCLFQCSLIDQFHADLHAILPRQTTTFDCRLCELCPSTQPNHALRAIRTTSSAQHPCVSAGASPTRSHPRELAALAKWTVLYPHWQCTLARRRSASQCCLVMCKGSSLQLKLLVCCCRVGCNTSSAASVPDSQSQHA